MVVAVGIDLVEISRIEEVLARRGERFRSRVFTEDEIRYCEQRAKSAASYAARFAAKEATMKALGTGWSGGTAWRDIEVVIEISGAPALELRGRALERLRQIGVTRTHLSLSHSGTMAIAEVVLEAEGKTAN